MNSIPWRKNSSAHDSTGECAVLKNSGGNYDACAYREQGFASIDVKLTDNDLTEIARYLNDRANSDHPGNILDNQGRLRAVHGYNPGFAPTLMARLSQIAKSLIGCDETYVYQFRANIKHPSGDGSGGWQPHRDFDYWKNNDGIASWFE